MDTHTQTLAPDLVTIAEAAKLLGVHPNTVRNRVKAGTIPATKVLTPKGEAYAIPRQHVTPLQNGYQSDSQNSEAYCYPNTLLASFNDPQNGDIDTLTMSHKGPLQGGSQQQPTAVSVLIEATARQADELRRVEALYREQIAAKDELIAELRRRAEEAERHTTERATPEHGNARFRVLRWLAHQLA